MKKQINIKKNKRSERPTKKVQTRKQTHLTMLTENRAKDPMEKTIIGNWKIMIMIQLFKKFRAKREQLTFTLKNIL